MEYHGKLEMLLPARRTYFGQYALLCLLRLVLILLGLNILIKLAALFVPLPPSLWIIFNLMAAALAAAYFGRNRPNERQFIRWLDENIDSKERLQTLFELEQSPLPGKTDEPNEGGYRLQTSPRMQALIIEETGRYLADHPPVVSFDYRPIKRRLPALLAALIFGAALVYVSPSLSQMISRERELKLSRLEAAQTLTELEELLSGEPLLEELGVELNLLKQQLAETRSPEEVELSLQEVRELLAEYAEKLDQAGQAYQLPQELLSENSAAEIASALQEDPRFNQQLLDSLQGLEERLFQLGSAGALDLKQEISAIEDALATETDIAAEDMGDLQELMERLDPASAEKALQAGLKQLAASGSTSHSGEREPSSSGAATPGDSSTGRPGGNNSGRGNGSGQPGDKPGQGTGQGEGQGQAGTGESSGNSGSSGQSGSGVGEQSGGSGTGSGSSGNGSEGLGAGTGSGGGVGSGAGTGSGALSEQQFYFIPGDQQVNLGGGGEENTYTWQELLKYNPALVPENLLPYYDRYYHEGITSINRGEVPPPLENYLRAYFQAITPP